jgi:protein SCO1/2
MSSQRKFPILNIFLAIAALAMLGLAFVHSENKKPLRILPIYGEKEYNTSTKDTDYHTVMPFKMTDQLGQTVTLDTFKNKVFVANFFYATCPGICKKMNGQLESATKSFVGNAKVKFVSYTVDPVRDSVPVLLNYAQMHDAVPYQWYFLTGNKKEIYELAHKSYYAAVDDSASMNFVHTDNMVLIDTHDRIRGVYKGTDSADVSRMVVDIKLLLQEEPAK